MKETEIVITPEGEIKIEASGYTGGDCLKALAEYMDFMKAHGVEMEVKDQKKKPAFYQVATAASSKQTIGSR